MVVKDPAFEGAGTKPGLEIWRIKNFKCIPLEKSEYGNFYQGDSYIVMSTRVANEVKSFDVHFWLGKEVTQDEAGTAAIKTVELDDSLGGIPVQYRQVQDHESSLFLSYFKTGITYLKGGYESGFRHVDDPKWEPRLFQCKGKRNVRVQQVDMKRESLNLGDVFILDLGMDIYVWMPPKAGRLERIKGVHHAKNIRDAERAGRGKVRVVDVDWATENEFWDKFEGDHEGLPDGKDDVEFEKEFARKEKPLIMLFRVTDASGKMEVHKVAEQDIKGDMLETKDAFILDAGTGGVFVWVGKACTMDERSKAMAFALEYLKKSGRPSHLSVVRVLEGAEPAIFTQWFVQPPKNRPTFENKLFQVSDETGQLVVEEISDFDQADLDGDDVMILDANSVVYVWIGSDANEREKKAALSNAQKYISSDPLPRGINPSLKTLEQGEESIDFKNRFKQWDDNLFKGRTVEAEKANV